MSIIDTSVKRPVTIGMALVAIMILGFVSLARLPVDFFPNLELPILAIATSYSGAGPREVENSVTRVIESAVSTVNNIDYIESTSVEGNSVVQITFNWGANMDTALSDVREALDLVQNRLPDGVGRPIVMRFSPDMFPIMGFALSGSDDAAFLYELADSQISHRLQQVPGVANVDVSGGRKREIHVDVSKNRLQAFGLDIGNITRILMVENKNVAGGYTYEGVYKYVLRTTGEFRTLDDIRNVIITMKGGVPIRLMDVADVNYGFNREGAIVRINQEPGLRLSVYKEAGLNTVNVAKDTMKAVEELNHELPAGIRLVKLMDSAEGIQNSIGGVGMAAIGGAIFAIFILFLYLWDWRSLLIIGLSIPTSIIVTFIMMYFFNVSLNIISLAGLALGVGMMVDSSIVVLENIYYHRRRGKGKYSGAIDGTKEVALAITASTFTTIAVFLPIVFVEGMVSQIFRDLGLTVSISLLASLIVALTLIPMLTSKIKEMKENRFFKRGEKFTLNLLDKVDALYGRFLEKTLRHKKITVFGTFFGVITLLVVLVIVIGKEGMPSVDEGRFNVQVTLPVGTRVEYTDTIVRSIEQEIIDIAGDNIENITTQIRGGGIFAAFRGVADYRGNIRINLVPANRRTVTQADIIEEIRRMVQRYPGKINVRIEGGMQMGAGDTPIRIQVRGDNIETADELANRIVAVISEIEGIREPRVDRDDGLPELQVRVNRNIASKVGLNAQNIATSIRTGFGGQTATRVRDREGLDIDVIVSLREEDRLSIDDLETFYLPSPTGRLIPLASVVDFEKTLGPTAIRRKDSIRYVNVVADIYGRSADRVEGDIRRAIDEKVFIPRGFYLNYEGTSKEMRETFGQLIIAMLLAIILVYAIMASQFESLIAPFVIMFCVPFGAVGSLLFLLITGSSLSIVSGAGIVVLVGIVINNGIVLIDYINQLNLKGMHIDEAAHQAGMRRLRPVSMTTLTTVLGMIPMALGLGEGGELYSPLALSILGGLLISMIFTLIVVPTAYAGIRKRFPLRVHEDGVDELVLSERGIKA
jgi:HAE1 family hydrophobic/amphiphilic exporter-1